MRSSSKGNKSVLELSSTTNNLNEATWITLSVLTEHWQSDLKFFQDELRFLRTLINKYFVWLIEEENINKTRALARKLTILDDQRNTYDLMVSKHLHHLHGLIENPFVYDAHTIKQEHEKIEQALSRFVKDFRDVKREAFSVTEHVIESEKAQHLLTGDVA